MEEPSVLDLSAPMPVAVGAGGVVKKRGDAISGVKKPLPVGSALVPPAVFPKLSLTSLFGGPAAQLDTVANVKTRLAATLVR